MSEMLAATWRGRNRKPAVLTRTTHMGPTRKSAEALALIKPFLEIGLEADPGQEGVAFGLVSSMVNDH
jgi:hypothetical protein